jgi:hypothetical protein
VSKIAVRVALIDGGTKIWERRVESPWQRKGPWVINVNAGKEAGNAAAAALAYTLRQLAIDIAADASIRRFAAGRT